ncbi:MAG: adenylate/guanylate cyclase domain-containing protein [Bacteroidetes bacterium]|nr:adenylate/guanylate cyclase domain-containing protein [Bacteroidota bacterium]MBU1718678.1 adenylate/guanylate cyclase domain-containing protein [Bacteroidota bacterium]
MKPDSFLQKIRKDKWYFVSALGLIILIGFVLLFRDNFLSFFRTEMMQMTLFGKAYRLDVFDGIIFTLFIMATIWTSWYFGGHAAFMFTAISWNFEILLFMAITGRLELTIEFLNVFLFLYLYPRESKADRKDRLYKVVIENKNIELLHLSRAYARFVPMEFLRYLKKNSITDVHLGDSTQEQMTVLFSDIRSFTSLSETMSPQENFNYLNSYLGMVGPVIRNHNGFIDKYIGDGIMALFPGSPDDAVACAIQMRETLEQFNNAQTAKGFAAINIGIGIHTGLLMLGTIGTEERMDSTVISDAVNLSSRLEGLTKLYEADIIVSESTYKGLVQSTQLNHRFLDKVKVKGKTNPIEIWEFFGGQEKDKRSTYAAHFDAAVSMYFSGEFDNAYLHFKEMLNAHPGDKAVYIYLARCMEKLKK